MPRTYIRHQLTEDRPFITPRKFKELLDNAQAGDIEFVEEMQRKYYLTPEQQTILKQLLA